MAGQGARDEERLRRKATLPFFYTAPLALALAGALIWTWGGLALSTPWSAYTLALTHVFTLGFLSMSCVGLVYLMLEWVGSRPALKSPSTHAVYWLLLVGASGLVWGTSQLATAPVFFAIAAVGLMSVLFLVQAGRALRRATKEGITRQGLALALWGFGGVAFLGVWLAHGHGGMQFPGPRALWMQVHGLVGLLAWVGGLFITLSTGVWPALTGGRPLSSRVVGGIVRGVLTGLVGSTALLLSAYFFLEDEGAAVLSPWVALFTAPMAISVWIFHSWFGLRSLAGLTENAGLLFWRTGLGLGPWVLLCGASAWALGDTRLTLLFGWLALYGWAGLLICGALVRVVPALMDEGGAVWESGRETWLRLSFGLHVAALVVGGVGIVSQRDDWIRIAGLLVLLHGLELAVGSFRTLRPHADDVARGISGSSAG